MLRADGGAFAEAPGRPTLGRAGPKGVLFRRVRRG
jgi:hypothetical protein